MKNNRLLIIISIILVLSIGSSFYLIKYNDNDRNKAPNVINIDDKDNKDTNDDNNINVIPDDNTNKDDTNNNVVPSDNSANNNSSNNNSNSNTNNNNSNNKKSNTSSNNSSSDTSNKTTNTIITNKIIEKVGDLIISDDDYIWDNTTNLKIFDVDKLSPGDNGTYDFVLNNNSNRDVKYDINFIEVNEYKANMLYKLKKNNEYIAGDDNTYVKYDELNTKENFLGKGIKDNYILYWKWVDSPNDTAVGRAAAENTVTYTLKINVKTMEAIETVEESVNPITVDKIMKYFILLSVSIVGIVLFIILNKKRKKDM